MVVLAAQDLVGRRQVRHLGVLSRDCVGRFVFDTFGKFRGHFAVSNVGTVRFAVSYNWGFESDANPFMITA